MAEPTEVTVNGVLHDWECLTIVGPHGTFIGIQEINYKSKQEKKNRYGKGGVPRGVGRTNYEPEGSMTLDTDEWNRLSQSLGAEFYRAKFNIVVSLEPPDSPSTVDTLVDCMINSVEDGAKQGDDNIPKKVDLRIGMIKRDSNPEYS